MSKAVLVMDMPEDCDECPLLNGSDECIMQDEDTNFLYSDDRDGLRLGCPLRELPASKPVPPEDSTYKYENIKAEGWNECLDAITGGTDDRT